MQLQRMQEGVRRRVELRRVMRQPLKTPEQILRELQMQAEVVLAAGDKRLWLAMVNGMGQWHRLMVDKARHPVVAGTPEPPEYDADTLAELEKNAEARRQRAACEESEGSTESWSADKLEKLN